MFDDMVNENVDSVIMEVSSQGLKLHRVSCCDYDVAVFTNFSEDHIGGFEHEDMEDYFNSKLKLFKMCKKALINLDNPYSQRLIENTNSEIVTYSIESQADITAKNITTSSNGVSFRLVSKWGEHDINVSVPGKFSVYNALAAIGVCLLLGIDLDTICKGLNNISVPGRAEIVPSKKDFTVMIDYAHTPDSLKNILSTVKDYTKGRVISVFGCGGDRDRTKRPLMGEISGNIADFTIITSDNPRTESPMMIIKDIEEGMKKTNAPYIVIEDRTQAIKKAIEMAKKDDVIVLAGKGHETYQIFKDKTIHYDEKEIVSEILKEID